MLAQGKNAGVSIQLGYTTYAGGNAGLMFKFQLCYSCCWSNGSTELNCLISTFVSRWIVQQPATFAPEHSVLSLCSGTQCLLQQLVQLCRNEAVEENSDAVDSLTTQLTFCYVWDRWQDFRLVFAWSHRLNSHYNLEYTWLLFWNTYPNFLSYERMSQDSSMEWTKAQ